MRKPLPPPKPLPNDCCGTGCIPCVNDVYEAQLAEYEKQLALWESLQQSAEQT